MPITDQTPDVVLYDFNGVELNVANGVAVPANTSGLLLMGQDPGGIARRLAAHTDGVASAYLPLGAQLLRSNSGWVSSGVISAVPVTLRDLVFTYKGPNNRWVMIFDAAAVPANGTMPSLMPLQMSSGAGNRVVGGYTPQAGDRFTTGICFAISLTEDTLTLEAVTNLWVTAQFTSL
jgi:hypothetical protein